MKKIHVPTIAELETLSTHELSDLLANVVLLRRMPDVPLIDVTTRNHASNDSEAINEVSTLAARLRREPKRIQDPEAPDWLSEESI